MPFCKVLCLLLKPRIWKPFCQMAALSLVAVLAICSPLLQNLLWTVGCLSRSLSAAILPPVAGPLDGALIMQRSPSSRIIAFNDCSQHLAKEVDVDLELVESDVQVGAGICRDLDFQSAHSPSQIGEGLADAQEAHRLVGWQGRHGTVGQWA